MYEVVVIKDSKRIFTLYVDGLVLKEVVDNIKNAKDAYVSGSILIINEMKKGKKRFDFIWN